MVAVITKGDTTRYNAAAFKTLVGDNMAELFKKFPGMEFDGTRLTFRGTTVDRIEIDNKRLFSNDVKLALENIRADDVISVDVYKATSDWDKLNNIENGKKLTVANVKTKSKPNRVFNNIVALAGGQEIDRNNKGRYEKKYEASGSSVFSQVGKTINANASYNNTGNTPSKNLMGVFKFYKAIINKLAFSTDNSLNHVQSHTENSLEQIYFPTSDYTLRSYVSNALSDATNCRFISRNGLDYTFKTKDQIALNLNFDYSANKNDNSNSVLATLEGTPTNNMDMRSYSKASSVKTEGSIIYRKKFGSPISGMTITSHVDFSLSDNDNSGWRVDTTASSTSRLYLTNSGNGREHGYGAYVSLEIPIKKDLLIEISNKFNYIESRTRRTAIDMFTGLIDTTNTQNYTLNYLKNDLSFNATYNSKNRKSTGHQWTSLGIGWERQEQQRDEFFPRDYSIPRRYNIPTGTLASSFNIKGQRNVISFDLSSDPLPIEYLRDIIDDQNPTRLSVGNPNLKMPVNLRFQYKGGIPLDKKGTSIAILINGNNIRNYVTTRTEYFNEDTFLPQYNYTIARGATLTTRENVSESWRFSVSTNLYIRLLGSNASFLIGYDNEKTPSYVGVNLYTLLANKYTCGFNFNTAFSSVFDVKFISTNRWIRSFNGVGRNDSFTGNLSIVPSLQLDKRSRVVLSGGYSHYSNRQMVNEERNDFILTALITRAIDKKGNFTLSLYVRDILNQQSSIAINLGEDYTSTSRSLIPGRYWIVKAAYKF
jgi:hypothetical protein